MIGSRDDLQDGWDRKGGGRRPISHTPICHATILEPTIAYLAGNSLDKWVLLPSGGKLHLFVADMALPLPLAVVTTTY